MKNQPGTMNNHKNPARLWITNLEPWKTLKTDLEPWKLTWSCTGWLWGVQVVTGDSQEEVLLFVTNTHTLHHNIYIIVIITIITIINMTLTIGTIDVSARHRLSPSSSSSGKSCLRWKVQRHDLRVRMPPLIVWRGENKVGPQYLSVHVKNILISEKLVRLATRVECHICK